VETIVALCVLLLVVVIVLSVFSTARRGVQLSENHVNAALLGRSLLEDARRGGFDRAVPGTGTTTLAGLNNGSSFSQAFHYSTSVQALGAGKKLVWVDVTWHEATGDKKVTLETLLVKL